MYLETFILELFDSLDDATFIDEGLKNWFNHIKIMHILAKMILLPCLQFNCNKPYQNFMGKYRKPQMLTNIRNKAFRRDTCSRWLADDVMNLICSTDVIQIQDCKRISYWREANDLVWISEKKIQPTQNLRINSLLSRNYK